MLVRKWEFEDILKISELEKECFTSEVWSYATLVSCFENPAFCGLVGEEDGEIIAFGGITCVCETADLETIAVSEPYRHSGYGTQLLRELLREAQNAGAEKVFLEVRVSNSAALALYIKSGFCGVYARTRYYSDGEDCLVMSVTFKNS